MDNNIKARREALGFSQDTLADAFKKYGRSSIKRQNISTWERGEKVPSLENAMILAEILQCDINDLFTLD